MTNGLAPCFTTKYTWPYENFHNMHPDVYILKLSINFVAHLTFDVSKLKLFLCDE